MPLSDSTRAVTAAGQNWFATTHWSVVLRAGDELAPRSRDALEELCKTYWLPLYAFVRRQGEGPEDAEDLTQAFFAAFLEKRFLQDVDPSKGKFRSFLLASLKHFLANQRDFARAQKRGGGVTFVALDTACAEDRLQIEISREMSPDELFERQWAITVMDAAFARLREEAASAGKLPLFEALKDYLSGEPDEGEYEVVATKLNLKRGTVAVTVHRLRQRYRELLRAVVTDTLADPAEVEEEMRHLMRVLSRGNS